MKVDFATFCYSGDVHRLHASGQLKKQVDSNGYNFDNVIVIYQWDTGTLKTGFGDIGYPIKSYNITSINNVLEAFSIKLDGQYQSPTDKHHNWKNHIVNHIVAITHTTADYIVFADNDCWIVRQPGSWVERGIEWLQSNRKTFIVSPNDGELERMTQRMSQQMFLVKVDRFRNMDFNQPGWDGNVNIPNGPMPEYHAMLEGRIHHYCKYIDEFRYVLPPDYRYWHFNKIDKDGNFEPLSAY